MFNQNQLQELEAKLRQLTNSNLVVINLPADVNQGSTFSYSQYRSVKALTNIKKNSRILIFQDSNTDGYFAIAEEGSRKENNVISENKFLNRHTQPIRLPIGKLCELLNVAFVYRIADDSAKTQDFWLVDFEGVHHHLVTISAATEQYGDATYTFSYTFPAYNYEFYEIRYGFTRSFGASDYDPGAGRIEATGLTGSEGAIGGTGERPYPPGQLTPPNVSVGLVNITSDQVAARIIPRYSVGDPFNPTETIGQVPPTSIFDGGDDPDDTNLSWGQIWNGGTVQAIVGDDGIGISLVPWTYSDQDQDYFSFQQTNPDGIWEFEDTDNDGDDDQIRGRVFGAPRYITEWLGDLEVSVAPGQSKPPPEDVFSETEAYISHANGRIQILIRDSGRPINRGPGEAGQPGEEDDPWFGNIYQLELGPEGIVASASLPTWMTFLASGDELQVVVDNLDITIPEQAAIFAFLEPLRSDQSNLTKDLTTSPNPIPVRSGIQTVFGWIVSTLDLNIEDLETTLLTGTEPETFAYTVTPVHAVDDPNDSGSDLVGVTGGGTLEEDELPFVSDTSLGQVSISPFENQGSFNAAEFSVTNVLLSWTENTINICHDTSKIVTPEVGGS